MIKYYLLLFSLLSCENMPYWQKNMMKYPPNSKHINYSKVYLKGWREGCESGSLASANNLYRLKYKYKQDWKLLHNPTYVNAWEKAYNQCRKYVFQHNNR